MKNSSIKILNLRDDLCKLVLQLSSVQPENTKSRTLSPLEKIAETLDPFFDSIISAIEKNPNERSESYKTKIPSDDELFRGITPLVIACDRGNLACVLYFCQLLERQVTSSFLGKKFWGGLIGSPLKSRTLPDETTVFHHCTTELAIQVEQKHRCRGESFLELLERISIALEALRDSDGTTGVSGNDQDRSIILQLGEAVNSHGDTPLMMAVANNIPLENGNSSAKAFLGHWYMLALDRCHPETEKFQKHRIHNVLTAKNALGRTVLSYAWVGGVVDLVKWLIDIDDRSKGDSIHLITSEETLEFRKSVGMLGKRIQNNDKHNIDIANAYKKKQMATEECTGLLEAHVKRCSEMMAQQLLKELDGDSISSRNLKSRPTKKKKKKKKKQPQHQYKEDTRESVENASCKNISADSHNSERHDKDDLLRLTKLTNGRLAVKVPGQQQEDENKKELPSAWYRKRTFSLDETNQLLRDRYKEGATGVTPTLTPTTPNTPKHSSDADSVLSALCLDVNCLLYSDQGMALNLSPAQLDAVEQILREQLQSVAKARILQERRYKAAASNSILVTNATNS